jgi:hypothetical protein
MEQPSWFFVVVILGFSILLSLLVLVATTTTTTAAAVAAYVPPSSPSQHHSTTRPLAKSWSSSSRQIPQQHSHHHHCLVLAPPALFFQKSPSYLSSSSSSPSSWSSSNLLLSATNDTSSTPPSTSSSVDDTNNDGEDDDDAVASPNTITNDDPSVNTDVVVVTKQQQQQHQEATATTTTSRFQTTVQEMATAIQCGLQFWKLKTTSTSSSSSTDSSSSSSMTKDSDQEDAEDVVMLFESLLQNVQDLQVELEQVLQQQQQQQQQQPTTSTTTTIPASSDVHELLDQARLKLKQYSEQRQELQQEMVALKEHYEAQIDKWQKRLQLPSDALEREALFYKKHEQEIQALQDDMRKERLDAERRIGQVVAQARHDQLVLETKYNARVAALEAQLSNTTQSLNRAQSRMDALQGTMSQLRAENERLQDDIILLTVAQNSVRKLVRRLCFVLWSRSVGRAWTWMRRVLSVNRKDDAAGDASSKEKRQQQQKQDQKGEGSLPLSLRYQSLALKKTTERRN